MIWLVTGGRGFGLTPPEIEVIEQALGAILLDCSDLVTHLINGLAPGVDMVARDWAIKRGIQPVDCPALWDTYPSKGPKNAGSRRNTAMLQLEPHWVIAFPGAAGTADMVSKTRDRMTCRFGRTTKLIEVKEDGNYREFSVVR